MNKLLRTFFTIIFIFLSIASANELIFTEEEKQYIKNNTANVGLLNNFYPFTYQKNNKNMGYSYELLKLISKKSNLKLTFIVEEWAKNLSDLKSGKIDILDATSYTKEREKYINFTKQYFEIPLLLYGKKSIDYYDGTLESLKGKKIAIIKDIFYTKVLKDLKLFKIVYVNTIEEKLNAVRTGETDLAIGSLLSVKKRILEKENINIKILDELKLDGLKKEDLRFAVHKNNSLLFSIVLPSLISRFIKQMSSSGLARPIVRLYLSYSRILMAIWSVPVSIISANVSLILFTKLSFVSLSTFLFISNCKCGI